jgi:hypothetical protein
MEDNIENVCVPVAIHTWNWSSGCYLKFKNLKEVKTLWIFDSNVEDSFIFSTVSFFSK